MINPEVIKVSDNRIWLTEGCLSIPGIYAPVIRPACVSIRYSTPNNDDIRTKLTGMDARVFQHELDHLSGEVFIDKMDVVSKEKYRAQLEAFKEVCV